MTTILHLSDPHFGAADPKVAANFLERANSMTPDITVLSGDMTMRARKGEMSAAKVFVDALPEPRLLIPGNHDIPAINQPYDRFFRSFKRYQLTFGAELEPTLDFGDIRIVSLNSSRAFGFHSDWSEGRLSTRQLATALEKFSGRTNTEFRILVLHHPLLELQVAGRQVVRPLKQLMETIEAARVDLVVCGHFHRTQIHPAGITDKWKAVISQAPTVCSTRLQGEPQGFHEIRLHRPEQMEIIHHVYADGQFLEAGSFGFERGNTGWNFSALHKDAREN